MARYHPNKPSVLRPEGSEAHRLTAGGENSVAALEALAAAVGAKPADAKPQKQVELTKPTGALTHATIAHAVALAIPENDIVVERIHHHRSRLLSADRVAVRRMTGCRTWAARSDFRRRSQPVRRSHAPTGK